jgi:rsbT antagonist protein RsbS
VWLVEKYMDENSIPVIELWGRLVVPLQGDLTDSQLEHLRDRVLQRIRERGATGLAVDASGLAIVDSHLCAVLGRLGESARLMGTRTVLSGLSPAVVMTLTEMGIGLNGVDTALSLEAALEQLGVLPEERLAAEETTGEGEVDD